MTRLLQREIEDIKKSLMRLSTVVEQRLSMAIEALEDRKPELAQQVMQKDIEIDTMEVELEEECLKILALHQPVAIDLRTLVTVMKINNELERIGDLAVNIAERAEYLSSQKPPPEGFDFPGMMGKVAKMLRNSLDSIVNVNADTAYEVCAADEEVDEMNRQMYELVKSLCLEGSEGINTLIHLLSVSRHLERIADHATNIAEDVIYMITGDVVRHHVEDYCKHKPPHKAK